MFTTIFKISKWYLSKPVIVQNDYAQDWFSKVKSNKILIISSEHAINYFKKEGLTESYRKLFPNSLEIDYLDEMASKINEEWVVGIGGGRVIDSAKYLTWKSKKDGNKKIKLCVIPSVTSTTTWLNMGIAVRYKNRLAMPGNIHANIIIYDPKFVASAPPTLNLGGLADLIACSSAISDWKLSHERINEKISKKGCEAYKQFVHEIMANMGNLIPFTTKSAEYIYDRFLTALALCGASLSDRPLEGSEHFLYYLIDELHPKAWNHGQIIAFTSLICLYLHKNNAFLNLEEIKKLYEHLGIKFRMNELQINSDLLRKALLNIKKYVIENKKHYSIWNDVDFENNNQLLNDVINFAENL